MGAKHLLVVDPIYFRGGSKVATEYVLELAIKQSVKVTVLTVDKDSWKLPGCDVHYLNEWEWLKNANQGVAYFIRHSLILFKLLYLKLKLNCDMLLGASGPGIDLSLYLCKLITPVALVQLIHGPVAASTTIARCLLNADSVFYLENSRDSLVAALKKVVGDQADHWLTEQPYFSLFENGIPQACWPSRSVASETRCLWAASLLRWKQLPLLLEALQKIPEDCRPDTSICYIRPTTAQSDIDKVSVKLGGVEWFESPANLDEIRSSASVFISTSKNEPFGLSILEALAAGLTVLIPADGAYWDRQLTDGVNCIKYSPGSSESLAEAIQYLSQDFEKVTEIGTAGRAFASRYSAEKCYQPILDKVLTMDLDMVEDFDYERP